jgi:hypothetical protein
MPSKDKEYKLDRTAFKAQTFEEANNHYGYWEQKTLTERLEAAYYLIRSAYGFLNKDFPLMDRSFFSTRKFEK